jgi:hypothetical protein
MATSEAAKQSILSLPGDIDCFAQFITGRRFAPTRWLAMTVSKPATSLAAFSFML